MGESETAAAGANPRSAGGPPKDATNQSQDKTGPEAASPNGAKPAPAAAEPEEQEYDDFGLPIKKFSAPLNTEATCSPVGADEQEGSPGTGSPGGQHAARRKWSLSITKRSTSRSSVVSHGRTPSATGTVRTSRSSSMASHKQVTSGADSESSDDSSGGPASKPVPRTRSTIGGQATATSAPLAEEDASATPAVPRLAPQAATAKTHEVELAEKTPTGPLIDHGLSDIKDQKLPDVASAPGHEAKDKDMDKTATVGHSRDTSTTSAANPAQLSEFSHQALTTKKEDTEDDGDGGWQTMPSYAAYDIYDDDNRLIAKEYNEQEDGKETYGYGGLGGAGKGYTKVLVDDDAQSATSMDENTSYLFKNHGTSLTEEEEEARDAVSQLQATKDLLTEGQRIAYVGLTRLEVSRMTKEFEDMEHTKKSRKEILLAAEALKMWSQKIMIRLYAHMEITTDEQIMIEQLSAHGVEPADLTPVLMANSRVSNPMADEKGSRASRDSVPASPGAEMTLSPTSSSPSTKPKPGAANGGDDGRSDDEEEAATPPPPYEAHSVEEMPDVRMPSQLQGSAKIDIDLRWTVLCDLFLVLIADSVYDARSRCLLERVGKRLGISWLDICRFEKKVTDALEMQQQAEKENWNEDEHMETRRKLALKRRYVMMGLATVGGGLVIGLSAGVLAPMIGAGLVAGFGAIGVSSGTGFLVGGAGAAIITTGAATSGSIIGVRAANRRTGSVRTFEYRPLHNNKRVNLIVTVSGWMTGKVDDVRLPFSTVDSAMGDIYSVLWEPEMLRSMGDTINILATEALTQGLQQVLASTFLTALMAALTVPVVLTKLAYLIDNPWAVSLDRATAAGLILADSLIDRNLGTRPVTLVGYSLGSRVIFSCLLELARKGALGLVQNVYLFGSPVVAKRDEYLRARSVVAGRFVNAYNRNDWILGYLFRLTNGGIRRVAGLAPVEDVAFIENMDVSGIVGGHMDYRAKMPRLLRECGWLVESDEFAEIEDPDPENHSARQRELINEIEEARKELENESKSDKGGWLSFRRKKKALKKKEWEIYEDAAKGAAVGGGAGAAAGAMGSTSGRTEDKDGNNHGVLFDVEAIRAELAKEAERSKAHPDELLEARELPSTLPPMRLTVNPMPGSESPAGLTPTTVRTATSPMFPRSPRENLRETQSAEVTATYRNSHDVRSPYEYKSPVSATYSGNGGGYGNAGYHNAHDGYGAADDGGIQMTFDTSFDEPPALSSPPVPPKDFPMTTTIPATKSWSPTPAATDSVGTRPGMTTAQTMPAMRHSNPWANLDDDYDDPDFGKEQEISMTFA